MKVALTKCGDLPEGWITAQVIDVVQQVPNVNPKEEPEREFGYVDIASICNSTFRIVDHKRIKGSAAPSRARRPIRSGDVLFSNVRTYLRNIALVHQGLGVQLCSTGFTVLRSNGAVNPRFLFRYVLTDDFLERVTPQQTGTHYPATSDRVVMSESIPLPPLAEQQRIVAKVEELLARVNAARERLARVPAILKRFRQAVLGAACSGRLTADWREKNPNAEPALFRRDRLLRERRILWEKCPQGRVKYKPPFDPSESTCTELPETWCWITTSHLSLQDVGFAFKSAEFTTEGIKLLRGENIEPGSLRWADTRYLPRNRVSEFEHLLIEEGDVILAMDRPVISSGLKIARVKSSDFLVYWYSVLCGSEWWSKKLPIIFIYGCSIRTSLSS